MIGTLSDQQIEDVLGENIFGRIGCNDGNKTYVVPINYVYDGKHIIAHSIEGLKIAMMRKNPNVCFEVDTMHNFTNWKSVIAWGQYQELTGERERYQALKLFVDRMLHSKISKTAIPPDIVAKKVHPHADGAIKPIIYRIVITEKTGRYENE
ncbi:MAG: pyridoxamine 5'-phosphate oxidase family protein [Saprospiraceae bacterium]|uniref:Pyridoxamine 5'-phosphate oxidase family protein n=1 Tax=Candidatus Opimibacter skivensis TaxID=2982028 RepID=A0A9D7SWM8_9BACT|nr:pyridoxamine 5'-phosphate oxidase family protein [Candidatus Opimibacter skivensis]